MMQYTVLIPFYRGDEYRERSIMTVVRHCWHSSMHQCRIVISEQNSNSKRQFDILRSEGIPIEVVNKTYSGRFNKSRAWNDGIEFIAKSATNPIILFLDSDILVEPNLLDPKSVIDTINNVRVHHPFNSITDLDKFDSHIVCTESLSNVNNRLEWHKNRARKGYRCYGGALFMRLNDYLAVGGYDSRYDAWGHEDDVFYYTCRRMFPVGQCIRTSATIYHIWHPIQNTFDYVRSDKYRSLATLRSESIKKIKTDVRAFAKSLKFSNGLFGLN